MAGRYKKSGGTSLGGDILRAIFIALFIITLAVVFVLYFRPLYYLDISFYHLDTVSGKSADVIRRNYDSLCNYLFFWNRNALVLPDFVMSEHGRIHFADCKRIFDVVQIMCLITGGITLIGALHRKHSARCLRIAGILTIAIPAVLGALAIFQWETLFVSFHSILFRNNYWLFDPVTDPIILVLPDGFFFQCAVVILIIVLIGGIFCMVRAHKKSRVRRRR